MACCPAIKPVVSPNSLASQTLYQSGRSDQSDSLSVVWSVRPAVSPAGLVSQTRCKSGRSGQSNPLSVRPVWSVRPAVSLAGPVLMWSIGGQHCLLIS